MTDIDTDAIRSQLRKHGDLSKIICAEMADEIDRLRAKLDAAGEHLTAIADVCREAGWDMEEGMPLYLWLETVLLSD